MTVAKGAEWKLLLILAAIQFTHITDFVILMPLGPQFMRVFALSASDFSLLVSVYTVSAAVSSLFGAFFLDRFDRKTALLFLYAGFGVATALCGSAETFGQLLLARTAAGAFGGTVSSVSFAIVGDCIAPERRGRAMGILMASFSAATVIGLPLGLALGAHAGWHAVFRSLAALSAGIWIAACVLVPHVRGHLSVARTRSRFAELGDLLGNRRCLTGLAFIASVMTAGFLIIPFLSPSLVGNVGVLESQLSTLYFVGGICTFFSSQILGALCDRFGHGRVFAVVASVSIFPMLLMTHLGPMPLWQVVPCSAFFMVFVSGRMVPAMAMLTSLVPPSERGGYMSLVTFAQQLFMGLAAFAAGHLVVADRAGHLAHYPRVGYLAVGVTLVSLLLARGLRSAPLANTPSA